MSIVLQPGELVGDRYTLTRPIASGGMGDVWEATDRVLDREVAVKILRTGGGPADEGFTERFRDEAKHAAALTHPNVAAVYDYGEDEDGMAYLVMERVPGAPLTEVIRNSGPLDPEQVRWILGQAALALAAAHDTGLVHRDVKPGNIIVTPEGMAKLTDFGIARAGEGKGHTLTGEVLGTPDYISPEQALGEPATPASDIYSLGVVAHEMLAGTKPFDMGTPVATALAHVNDTPPSLPGSLPEDLRTVVQACLAKSPEDRPGDAREVAGALGMPVDPVTPVVAVAAAAATTRMPVVTPETPPWRTRAESRAHGLDDEEDRPRRVWLLAPLAALVVALVFGVSSLLDSEATGSTTPAPAASTPAPTSSASEPRPTETSTATSTPSATSTAADAPPPPVKADPPGNGKGKPDDPGKGKGQK